jgi:hypothetical protein
MLLPLIRNAESAFSAAYSEAQDYNLQHFVPSVYVLMGRSKRSGERFRRQRGKQSGKGYSIAHRDRATSLRRLARFEACAALSKEAELLKAQHRAAGGREMQPSLRWTWRDAIKNTLKRKAIGMRMLGCRGLKGEFSVPPADAEIDEQIAKRMGAFGTISRKKKREAYQAVHAHQRLKEARDRRRAEEAERDL